MLNYTLRSHSEAECWQVFTGDTPACHGTRIRKEVGEMGAVRVQCGILNDRLGGKLDMVSYGPTIRGAHSPEETAHIESVNTFWDLTAELMSALAAQK